MNLESAIGVLRPRAPWEAVDFGWLLARRLRRPLAKAWLVTAVPVCVGLLGAFWSHPWIGLLVLWWLRPLFDTPLLYVLSRGLFGQSTALPGARETLRVLFSQVAARLTLRRFDPSRSYRLPVAALEGLTGSERRQRLRLLLARQSSESATLGFVCFSLELIVVVGLFGLGAMLLPAGFSPDWTFVRDVGLWEDPLWGRIAWVLWGVAASLVQPLYVAGGFGLYLNRRTLLEGWDIQLAFSRLASRAREVLAGVALVLLLLPAGLLAQDGTWDGQFFEVEVPAEETPSPELASPAEVLGPEEGAAFEVVVEEALASEEFGWSETRTVWRLREQPVDDPDTQATLGGFGGAFAQIAEILLWVLGAFLLLFLAMALLRLGESASAPVAAPRRELPTELLGLDVRPESLPDDVSAAARDSLARGDRIGALSLLYRGALVRLMRTHELELEAGATEADCLRAVQAAGGPATWFEGLTRAWQSEAYAHRPQPDEAIASLIDGWRSAVGEGAG